MRKNSIISLAIIVSFLLVGCETQKEASSIETPAVPVIATSPMIKEMTLYLESIGTMQPLVLMEVRPQIEGTLIEVLTSEGQWVVPGSPLFKIDPRPYLIKVQEAEAQLSIDQANLQVAHKKLNRFKPLAQKDLIAKTEWDDLEAEVERCQATLALDEARLDSAKLDLEHCSIQSPIAGRVGKLEAHPGFLVARGQEAPLATISQMNPLIVEFTVTEKEFPKISQETQKIEIKAICSSDPCKNGAVTFLDNHFDETTGLLLVRGKVLNEEYTLRPGQTVQVRIPVGSTKKAMLIPQKAIRYNQEGPYAYVVQSDMTVALRQLILGDEQESDQVVLQGLDPSDQLIVDGHLRLSPGLKVDVKP
jgi:multidrug efflux system membrane fusion protein